MADKARLVYWGAGKIGDLSLKQYPDIKPDFMIDSHKKTDILDNVIIKNPDEVENWDELFIVITTAAINEVEEVLNSKGLVRNQNYVGYKDFFSIEEITIEESILHFENYIRENKEYKNAIYIFAPIFSSRVSSDMIRFFRNYGIKRLPQKCILFSHLSIIKEEYAQKIVGYPFFGVPLICRWTGISDSVSDFDRSQLIHADLLLADEQEMIYKLEERKMCEDKELSYAITSEIYWFYKSIFSILQPSKVIIWGGWTRECYIMCELAKRNKVPYGFMEHGVIPGTMLFDRRGIAGQSEYAVEPDKLLKFHIDNKKISIEKIRNYIIANKIDTGKFKESIEDEKSLQGVDKGKKTVFFVGMDDSGMGMNPLSSYWKIYISSIFPSTSEALLFVAEICRNNGWNLVFKPHPSSRDNNILEKNDLIDNIIQIKYMEVDRLIQLSDVVVSISSAVDYKTLIYGRPLVQLGHTMLCGKGCSYEVNEINEIENQLKIAMEKGMTPDQNEKFELHMAQLLEKCLWDDLSEREMRYGLPLEMDFFDNVLKESD